MYDSNKDVTSAVDFDTFDSMTLLAILVSPAQIYLR